MTAAQLRQSILQAAVQGKLVPQNAHDEPASELLKRIQAEKARLIKEGKIKKEKPLPPIAEDEVPYGLPEGWMWVFLGEILHYTDAGKSPACKNKPVQNNEYGVIKTTAVQTYKFHDYENKILSKDFNINKNMLIRNNDILITRAGPKNRTGVVCLVTMPKYNIILSDKTVRLNCSDKLLYKPYIVWALNSVAVRRSIEEKMTGMAESQVNISQGNINFILFPLPPLAEQQRIVAKVDGLMALSDELEVVEKELDKLESDFAEHLPKSILQAAVQGKLVPQNVHDEPASALLERIRAEKAKLIKQGKIKKEKPLLSITEDEMPHDLPEGWLWCRFGEVCSINPRNKLADDVTVAFIPMALISSDYFSGHSQESQIWGKVKSGFTHFAENDVALAKITPCFQNGKSCVMRGLKGGFGAGTTELHILRAINILPEYILIYVKHPAFILNGAANMTGTAGQQRVPTEHLNRTLFPLPPLAEQQRIVAKVNELMALCNELKTADTLPIAPASSATVIPFPARATAPEEPAVEEEYLIAARGDLQETVSAAHRQARRKVFEDETDA